MEDNNVLYRDVTPGGVTRAESLAKFLKSSTRLDKKVLGDFLSRAENLEILEAFITLFDFKGVSGHGSVRYAHSPKVPAEICRRCYARITRIFPFAWRVATN